MKYIKKRIDFIKIFESKQLSKKERNLIELYSRYAQKDGRDYLYDWIKDYLSRIIKDYNLSNTLTPTLIKLAYSIYKIGGDNEIIFRYIDNLIKYKNLLKNSDYDILKRESEILNSENGNIKFNHRDLYIHPDNLKLVREIDNYTLGDNTEDYYINIMNSLNLYKNLFEELNDDLEKILIKNENRKFLNKFISNKYKHLVNNDTYKLFSKLKDYSHQDIQSMLTSKLAAFKSPEELNKAILNLINKIGNDISAIAKSSGCEIIYESEWDLVIYCPTFESIQKVGTSNWCIVRDKKYWDDYVPFGNKQYIVINKSYMETDPIYMIGVTIDDSGKISESFDQEDTEIYENGWLDEEEDYIPYDELPNFNIIKEYCKGYSQEELKETVGNISDLIKFQKLNYKRDILDFHPDLKKYVNREDLYSYSLKDDDLTIIFKYIDFYEDSFMIKDGKYYDIFDNYKIKNNEIDDKESLKILIEDIIDYFGNLDTKFRFESRVGDIETDTEMVKFYNEVKSSIIDTICGGDEFLYKDEEVYVRVKDSLVHEYNKNRSSTMIYYIPIP